MTSSELTVVLGATYPFTTTGLVSIPFGFFMGWLGTVLSHRGSSEQRRQYEAVEAWILAGARK